MHPDEEKVLRAAGRAQLVVVGHLDVRIDVEYAASVAARGRMPTEAQITTIRALNPRRLLDV